MSRSKDHHCRPAVAAPSSGEAPPPWSSHPMDLVQLVGWRVLAGDLLDYVRFRAACTRWRSSTVCPLGRGIVDPRFHPRRWMILPEGHPADGKKKRFFNLSTGVFAWVRHPFLNGSHRVLDSVDGLLLLQRGYKDNAAVWLLHPFTGDTVKFPPLMPLLKSHWNLIGLGRNHRVELKFIASLRVSADGTATVMIVHQYIRHVFFATNKVQQWSVSTWGLSPLAVPISSQGKLYILEPPVTHSNGQHILQLDPPSYENDAMVSSFTPPKLVATCPTGIIFCLIAECDSEILVVSYDDTPPPAAKLVLYKLADLAMDKVIPLTSIGGNTLFLDIDMSTAIEGGDIRIVRSVTSNSKAMPTIARNTIICPHDGYPWQFDLGTGIWSQIMGGCVKHSQRAMGAAIAASFITSITAAIVSTS
ncbi:hypothetical protein ACQ4PT_035808 [Festuca glaucescens]